MRKRRCCDTISFGEPSPERATCGDGLDIVSNAIYVRRNGRPFNGSGLALAVSVVSTSSLQHAENQSKGCRFFLCLDMVVF